MLVFLTIFSGSLGRYWHHFGEVWVPSAASLKSVNVTLNPKPEAAKPVSSITPAPTRGDVDRDSCPEGLGQPRGLGGLGFRDQSGEEVSHLKVSIMTLFASRVLL